MYEFKSWRRRGGLVMLAIACLTACMWFWSDVVFHTVNIPVGMDQYVHLAAVNQCFAVGWISIQIVGERPPNGMTIWLSGPNELSSFHEKSQQLLEIGKATWSRLADGSLLGSHVSNPRLQASNGSEVRVKFRSWTFPC